MGNPKMYCGAALVEVGWDPQTRLALLSTTPFTFYRTQSLGTLGNMEA